MQKCISMCCCCPRFGRRVLAYHGSPMGAEFYAMEGPSLACKRKFGYAKWVNDYNGPPPPPPHFLSDSPLESHVNTRTRSRHSPLEIVPSHPKGWIPLSPTNSVKGILYQWVGILSCCQWTLCGVDVKAHRQPLCSLPEFVSISRNINLTWGQVFPAYSLLGKQLP